MKVLQINSFFSVGGPPRIVKGIYDTLIEQGNECILAAGREKPIEGMQAMRIGTPINKYWHFFMSRFFDAQGLSSKHATKRLICKIQNYNPDIIHLHNLHGYYLNFEVLFDYLKKINKPVIWTLHDCWPITGHCTHFDYISCSKWKTGCYDCTQKHEYPKCSGLDRSEENYFRKKAAFTSINNLTIVTVSNWLADVVRESFLGKYPIKVIYNGIDLNTFKPTPSEFRKKYKLENKIVLLGVSQNWSRKKGLDDFIELSKRLDDKYKVVLVGLENNESINLLSNIIAIPKTNNSKELAEIYTASDIFLNLSVEETFGLVTAESLACGTPAIVYNKTAVPEVVDEHSGVVVDSGNINDLVSVIHKIGTYNLTKDNCIRKANEYKSSNRYVDYLQLYKAKLQKNGG